MVCQFLLYNKVNQLYIYIYPHISSLLASPSCPPYLSHPSRWSQSTELISLCYAAASHQLSILHLVVYIATLSLRPSLPFPSLCPQVHSLRLVVSCEAQKFLILMKSKLIFSIFGVMSKKLIQGCKHLLLCFLLRILWFQLLLLGS